MSQAERNIMHQRQVLDGLTMYLSRLCLGEQERNRLLNFDCNCSRALSVLGLCWQQTSL